MSVSVDDLVDQYEQEGSAATDEVDIEASSNPVDDEPDPVIEGLSFDDVKRLALERHDMVLSKDDPMLLYITIFNAALERADSANAHNVKKLIHLVDEAVAKLTVEVDEAVKPIAELALNTQFKAMLEEARLHASEGAKIHASLKNLAIGLGVVSVIVSLAAAASLYLFFVKS